MFVGELAISLNLLSIAVLAFTVSIALIAITSRLTLFLLQHFTLGIRKLILWSLVTAPWWIAASCVGFFWPWQQDLFPAAWLNDLAHWHHVDIFSFTSWHSVTLFSSGAYLLWSMTSTVYTRRKQSAAMSDLIGLSGIQPQETRNQYSYYSLPLAIPAAFTTGLISPKIYLTTALQERVNEQELEIIVRHEMSHVDAHDPLFKVVFAALAGFFPAVITRKLLQQFSLLTEQMADSAATTEYDNLDVAQTLINVARMQRNAGFNRQNSGCDGMQTSYFCNDQTSVRVQRLMTPIRSSSRLALGLALMLFATAPLFTVSAVDGLHHFIETFFTH
jgi:Zn-dependent protease with chaperone function